MYCCFIFVFSGQGLPAGLAQVEMIERARAKREWEKTLPELSDGEQVEKRRFVIITYTIQNTCICTCNTTVIQYALTCTTCTVYVCTFLYMYCRRMMEEQERLEWSYREMEIEEIQNERMELLRKMLQQREVDYHAINEKRIEHLW